MMTFAILFGLSMDYDVFLVSRVARALNAFVLGDEVFLKIIGGSAWPAPS